ncbi:Dihydrosphingosine 1-phosphate phosphatase [Verticillium dahliae VDG2]|nr:Dihydrosphingosine 1-phosphate phosphatase [Verticillium dahliae VDG2]
MSVVNGVLVAIPPPEGYVVDFDNPRRNSVLTAYVVSAVGMVFALLFMLQRLYVKAFVRHSLGIDDFLLVIAWLGSIAIQVLTIRSFAHTYMVVHGWEIPFEKFQDFALFAAYINSIVYTIPTCFSKVVILLFLKDMNNSQKWYRWSVCAAMFLVVGSSTGILFSSLFPCQPFRKAFDLTIRPDVGSCIDRQAMFQATASLGVVTDVIIIGIPIPMVLRLHMSKAKKAGLLLMFIIGSATVLTSMIRLALLISVLDEVDQTWGGGPIRVWICVEANLLIMCASLSTLKHFVRVMAPKLLPSTDDNTRGKSKSTAFSGHELQTFGGTGSYKPSQYKRSGNTRTGP